MAASSKSSSGSSSSTCRKPYDVLVIGGGTAGLTLAKLITDKIKGRYRISALILEAGQNLTSDPAVLDPTLGSSPALTFDPKYAFTFVDELSNIISGGKMASGSSSHNGLQTVHGTGEVNDQWALISGDGQWSAKSV